MRPLYEDNHIIIVYKESGEIVQGDKTGDRPLSETVKEYIKAKYHKPAMCSSAWCIALTVPWRALSSLPAHPKHCHG